MRRIGFMILLLMPFYLSGQSHFDNYFLRKSFRFDFSIGGSAEEENIFPQQMKEEPFWAGSVKNLIDTFHYGTYRVRILDAKNKKLIFSRGFNNLFQEWQSTPEARVQKRVFYQCLILPFPKQLVRLEVDRRQWQGDFKTIYKTEIDPDYYFIVKEPPLPYETVAIEVHGIPEEKVDLVILAEGYRVEEMNKFFNDARRVTGYLFEAEPFKSGKEKFNVNAVFIPSVNSGTDIPGEGVYKNTALNSSFYTFDIDRYLTSRDMKAIHDAAATVPYDHIYVLVNTERYGGGGIFNFLNICTSDNHLTPEVFIHEFGHGFAGLGDEYYSSSVAYEDFYNLQTEPWEPNLTTLVDFDSKWSAMINDSIPVPTTRERKYINSVGVYEGGGYQAKGIYSPYMNCRMKSNDADGFCPVCTDAIIRMIDFHCN